MDISNNYVQEKISDDFCVVYGIEKSEHLKNILIENLQFTKRTYNFFKRVARCDTVWDFLSCSEEQLMCLKGFGAKNLNEVRDKLKEIKKYGIQFKYPHNTIPINSKFLFLIEKILRAEDDINISDLSEEEKELYSRILAAVETMGIELCRTAYFTPDIIIPVLTSFKDYYVDYNKINSRINKLNQAFYAISPMWEIKPLYPLVMAYSNDKAIQNALLENFEGEEYIYKIDECFEIVTSDETKYDMTLQFLQFLKIDIQSIVDDTIKYICCNNSQRQITLECRANGMSLSAIAQEIGVTRERVRQIEDKIKRLFSRSPQYYSILWLVSAVLDGRLIIDENHFFDILSDINAKSVCYLLRDLILEKTYYSYNEDLRVFMLCSDPSEKIKEVIDSLPNNIINIADAKIFIEKLSKNECLSYEFIKKIFESRYEIADIIYFDKKMPLSEMFDYIIERFYLHGIKLFDEDEIGKFKNHVKNIFGKIKSLTLSNRAIDARIANIGILCDRGKYVHKNHVNIPDEMIEKINVFVQRSSRDSISYLELYEEFKEELLLCSTVDNKYYLQGVLKLRLNGKYHFNRDYISKSNEISMTHEIIKFVCERGEVSKTEIKAAFNGISEAMLLQILARSNEIISIDNALYIHSNTLRIEEADYEIAELIDENIIEMPASSRKLFEKMLSVYPDFLYRNSINVHSKLFGILKYMFGDKYRFSRPYITNKYQSDNVSTINIIKEYFKDFEILTIEELTNYCSEHHLRYLNLSGLITEINDIFLRKDDNELINLALLDLSDENLEKIKKLLIDDISMKSYLSTRKIDTFIYYPDIGVSWNGWIIHSIVKKFFDNIAVLEFQTSSNTVLNGIFVDLTLEIDNYEEFLKWLIKSEHSHSPFHDINEIKEWLIDEGVINIKLPAFLDKYVYADEYGKIIVI